MTLLSHIKIAGRVITDSSICNKRLEKLVLYTGCVAPDMYNIIKLHKAADTEKNVKYHINKYLKYKRNHKYIVLFQIGMLMHYVCDYYCGAHNSSIETKYVQHFIYEKKLGIFVIRNIDVVAYNKNDSCELRCYIEELEKIHNKYLLNVNRGLKDDVTNSLSMCRCLVSCCK